jgi:hypothetical protein
MAAFAEHCRDFAGTLITAASTAFSIPQLLAVARFMCRTDFEWRTRLAGNIQNPNALIFDGPGADRPFPALQFAILPNGNIIPWHWFNVRQPDYAVLASGFYEPPQDHPQPFSSFTPLRDATYVRIVLSSNDSRSYIKIHIRQREGNTPMRLFIHVSTPGIRAYPLFCGALLLLFFSNRSQLSRVPRPFHDSLLRVRILLPQDLVPNTPLPFPPRVRNAFGLLIVGLQRPDVVPRSGLQFVLGDTNRFHNVPLERVLYD